MDRPIKAINLTILGLQQKGAVQILSRNPLQLKVLEPGLVSTMAETALVKSLTDQGTLSREGVQAVLAALNMDVRTKMWRADHEATLLDQQQRIGEADVAARIDALRTRWQVADEEFAQKEVRRKAEWLELTTEAGAVKTKIEYLRTASRSIVQRSALERVLFERLPDLAEPRQGDPACPRCEQPNPSTSHFCRICARRLVDDRPGLLGSLDEIAEVNLHHRRFSEGMQACQEIIGLVRGLKTGIESFTESVADMRNSQTKHNLKTLQIDVPQDSIEYGTHFDRLLQKVRDGGLSLHPKVFAGHIQGLIAEVYTEDGIKEFFETMGEELSTQADAQW